MSPHDPLPAVEWPVCAARGFQPSTARLQGPPWLILRGLRDDCLAFGRRGCPSALVGASGSIQPAAGGWGGNERIMGEQKTKVNRKSSIDRKPPPGTSLHPAASGDPTIAASRPDQARDRSCRCCDEAARTALVPSPPPLVAPVDTAATVGYSPFGPLAQWQSSGLLTHWLRVRVPRGPPCRTAPIARRSMPPDMPRSRQGRVASSASNWRACRSRPGSQPTCGALQARAGGYGPMASA